MNKKTILLIILSIYSLNNYSQESKHTIAMTVGAAVPVENYGKKYVTTQKSGGYAKLGSSINLNYSYQFYKYMSARASLSNTLNSSDNVSLERDVKNALVDTSLRFQIFRNNPTAKVSILIGVQGQIPITKNISLTPYILAGRSIFFISEYGYTYNKGSSNIVSAHKGQCFSYTLGFGGQYKLSNKLSFNLNIDYNYSDVEFKNIKNTQDNSYVFYETYSFVHSTINPTLGLGYKF